MMPPEEMNRIQNKRVRGDLILSGLHHAIPWEIRTLNGNGFRVTVAVPAEALTEAERHDLWEESPYLEGVEVHAVSTVAYGSSRETTHYLVGHYGEGTAGRPATSEEALSCVLGWAERLGQRGLG